MNAKKRFAAYDRVWIARRGRFGFVAWTGKRFSVVRLDGGQLVVVRDRNIWHAELARELVSA